jgi:hypothetical protein
MATGDKDAMAKYNEFQVRGLQLGGGDQGVSLPRGGRF